LPEVECPSELGEFIAEELNLELKVGIAGGDVVNVAVFFSLVAVRELLRRAFQLGSQRNQAALDY
jgi:hypothetical protein